MLPDIEIYRTANVLVSHHGDEATAKAQERIMALGHNDDTEGVAVWLRIRRAVADLVQLDPVRRHRLVPNPALTNTARASC